MMAPPTAESPPSGSNGTNASAPCRAHREHKEWKPELAAANRVSGTGGQPGTGPVRGTKEGARCRQCSSERERYGHEVGTQAGSAHLSQSTRARTGWPLAGDAAEGIGR